ncbi:hypothetical protein NUW58_g2647 [Xylaria curta]|uniref:Uncharacterized protein n=1 Tax=Xylaria curta TaxID=42375 RepID=A0ACC1PEL3_9PEZI|nr:hypothetical protein NUW58_g2647 [Xylaria curta]
MADGIQLPDFPSILSQVDRRVFDNFKRLAEMTAENNNKLKDLEHAIKRLESKIDDIHAGHLGLTPDVYESLKRDQATFKQKETAHKKQLSTASILVGYRPGSPTKQWSQMQEPDEDKNGSRNIRTPRPTHGHHQNHNHHDTSRAVKQPPL